MHQKTTQLRYILYARKSSESEDRQVQSIADQIKRLKQLAADLKLEIAQVVTESKSAKVPNNRPLFEEMMNQLENEEFDGILCWQINRLSRNPIDSARIQWLLQQGRIRSIQTIDRVYKPEDNVLLFSVESGMANQFVIDLSKNVKRGMESKVDKGIYPHMAPAGYLNNVNNHTIIVDPSRFPLIRRAWDFMLTDNYTPPQIADLLNDTWGYRSLKRSRSGGKPIAVSGMYRVFSNLFYTGHFEWKGKIYLGKHKPMLSLEEFNQVQVLLGKKEKPRHQKHTVAYTGLIRCGECGCMITVEVQNKRLKNGGIRQHIYYRCTKKKRGIKCSQPYITAAALEEQIDEELKKVTILPEFRELALEILNRTNDKEIVARTKIHESLSRTLLDTQAQLDNLTKMRYRDLIGDDEFIKERTSLQKEIFKLKEQLRETENRAEQWLELTEKTFNFATYARYHFINGDLHTKKEIVRALGSNFILKDKKLSLQAKKWLKPITKRYPALEAEYRRLELDKKPLDKTKSEALASVCSTWGAIVKDVRTEIRNFGGDIAFPGIKPVPIPVTYLRQAA